MKQSLSKRLAQLEECYGLITEPIVIRVMSAATDQVIREIVLEGRVGVRKRQMAADGT
jgi:hypothetical protein